jgi:hypothetical protein
MGLVGIIDPSHQERKEDEPGRLPRWYPREELLERFITAPPKFAPYTYEIVNAALDQWQDRDYISTTMLTGGCARSKVLERKEDFILGLDDLWAAFRGTQVHRTLEFYDRPSALAEARFFTTIRIPGADVEVSCSPDLVVEEPASVVDYKAPVDDRSIPVYGYPWHSHVDQLQFNRFIVNHAERWDLREGDALPWDPRALVFKHLYVVYLGTRGPKVIEVQKSIEVTFKNGNQGNRKVPDIWDDEEVTDHIVPRLHAMSLALESYPVWPDGLEEMPGFEGEAGWRCPGKPWCRLPDCLAKRYPNGMMWENPPEKRRRRAA